MKREPRIGLLAIVLLVVSNATGCMVMEEMDKAAALMPDQKKGAPATTSAGETAGAGEPTANPLLEQSKQWWDRATSIAPTGLDSKIVRCVLNGGSQFMPRDDCRSRGGRPERVSG